MTMFVSSRNLPLIGIDLLASFVDGGSNQDQVLLRDRTRKTAQCSTMGCPRLLRGSVRSDRRTSVTREIMRFQPQSGAEEGTGYFSELSGTQDQRLGSRKVACPLSCPRRDRPRPRRARARIEARPRSARVAPRTGLFHRRDVRELCPRAAGDGGLRRRRLPGPPEPLVRSEHRVRRPALPAVRPAPLSAIRTFSGSTSTRRSIRRSRPRPPRYSTVM